MTDLPSTSIPGRRRRSRPMGRRVAHNHGLPSPSRSRDRTLLFGCTLKCHQRLGVVQRDHAPAFISDPFGSGHAAVGDERVDLHGVPRLEAFAGVTIAGQGVLARLVPYDMPGGRLAAQFTPPADGAVADENIAGLFGAERR